MKRLALVVLLWPAIALAQFAPQEWSADQDGMNNACYDVAYFQANNLAGGGVVCVNADNTGKLIPAACAAAGVSSVTGTATRLSATPTTGAVVVDLIATSVTPGSYTYAAFTVDAYGRLTVASSGTAPVTSIGVTAPITTTGGTTPTIGIALPNARIAYGTGTNVTTSQYLQWNGLAIAGLTSQQELQIYNDASTSTGVTGFRVGTSAAFTQSFAFDMIAPGWSAGGGLTAGDVLAEENAAATSQLLFSNFAGGPVKFASGSSRAPTFTVAPATAALGDVALFQRGAIQFGEGTTVVPIYGVATATQATYYAAFKDSAASKGATFGDGVPGSAPTNDAVVSTWDGASWVEDWRWVNHGVVQMPVNAAPGTPAASTGYLYEDSTSKNICIKNDAGTVNHGAQTQTAAAGKAFTALSDAGAFTETSFQAPISPTACGANTFGTSVSSAGALTCTQPNTGNITGWPAATDVLVSAGVSAAPVGDTSFTFDTTAHVLAGGNAIGVNGASVASNASFVVGNTTSTNRDRVRFLCGGGTLGASGTSDSTLVDIVPSATAITAGVTAGIYSTERVRAVSYSGASALTEAASVYIDGPPSLGGGVSSAGPWALHVASGTTLLGGAIEGGQLTAGGIVAAEVTTGRLVIAGAGGAIPAAVSGTLPYYINVTGSTLVTGGAVWLATSSTAGQGGTALEYVQSFAATNVALNVRIITNAITGGTLAVQITRNGSSFSTITLNSASSGNLTTGTVTAGSPSAGDRWGVLVSGTGTGMSGNMIFTADLLLAPNVF